MKKVLAVALSIVAGLIVMWAAPPEWENKVLIEVNGKDVGYYDLSKSSGKVVGLDIEYDGKRLYIKSFKDQDVYVNGSRCFVKKFVEDAKICEVSAVRGAKRAAFVMGVAITLFVFSSEIHYIVTSLLILILLSVLKVMEVSDILKNLSSPVIYIFLAGSAFEIAMKSSGLSERVSGIVLRHSKSKGKLILVIMLASSVLSALMSNTAATYVMLPVVLFIAQESDIVEPLLLSLVASTAIGGSLTLIGTPPNIIVSSFIKEITGKEMDFLSWLKFGLPTWMLGIIVVYFLTLIFSKSKDIPRHVKGERKKPWSLKEILALVIIVITVLLWSTYRLTGLDSATVSLIALFLFFATSTLDIRDFAKLRWDLAGLFGAGLALGKSLMSTGWADWLVGHMMFPSNDLELFLLLTFLLIVGTAFSSHTSAAALIGPVMIPLGMGIAGNFGVKPSSFGIILVMMATLSINNAMALPISTPPSAIVFSTGKIKIKNLIVFGLIFGIIMNFIFVFLLKRFWLMYI